MLQLAARQIRVLVVDDSSTFLSTLCSLLQDDPNVGLVTGARSGLEALAAVEQLHPDLVFIDLQLPELNGLEVTARLHSRFPDIRVVMMTARYAKAFGSLQAEGRARFRNEGPVGL
jgi:CheY-like chemotaxis protein